MRGRPTQEKILSPSAPARPPHLAASYAMLATSVLAYRVAHLNLPFFRDNLARFPFVNIGCGAASDMTLLAALAGVWLFFALVPPGKGRGVIEVFAYLLALVSAAAHAAHFRYVADFGYNLKPFQVMALDEPSFWSVGAAMVAESWQAILILVLSTATAVNVLLFPFVFGRPLPAKFLATKGRFARTFCLLALVGAVFNSMTINLRNKAGMHKELRYNILSSLKSAFDDERRKSTYVRPSFEQLLGLRQLLHGPRRFAPASPSAPFVLMQERISTGPAPTAALEGERRDLREFLAREAKTKGPWNVVLVLMESLRAQELAAFGNNVAPYGSLTPGFSALAKEGIRFTRTFGIGLRTHYGQTATQCGLYGTEDFSIMIGAPRNHAVCLSDVFAGRGYETRFYYGGDNAFDNHTIFYQTHAMKKVRGYYDFDPKGASTRWGYTDRVVFDYTLAEMSTLPQPFFSTVLTLSNHPPWNLPADAPEEIRGGDLPLRDQLVRYVDWSVAKFVRGVEAKLPHTIIVLLADHGRYRDDQSARERDRPGADAPEGARASPELLTTVARIPWMIEIPGLPESLRGLAIDDLTSNVDVAPTLFSMLGWLNVQQQFMGQDAFSRQGPVYVDWRDALLSLTLQKGALVVSEEPQTMKDIFGAASRYDLLAPKARDAAVRVGAKP